MEINLRVVLERMFGGDHPERRARLEEHQHPMPWLRRTRTLCSGA
jgi:hypothetical protein